MINKNSLIKLLQLVEMTNTFSCIYRKTIPNKDNSPESNSQHSFQLALLSWYINDYHKLNLSNEILMKYALVHDLVEVYSGNIPAYGRSSTHTKQKIINEKTAIKKLAKNFKQFKDLSSALNSYFALQDKESKFIYSLDKLLPLVNLELNNGSFYFDTKTTYQEMIKVKAEKIKKDPTINKYFELLCTYLKETKFFWPDCKERVYSKKANS